MLFAFTVQERSGGTVCAGLQVLLLVPRGQIGVVGDGGAFDPQCDGAFGGGSGFDVVDDQRGLRVVIDE